MGPKGFIMFSEVKLKNLGLDLILDILCSSYDFHLFLSRRLPLIEWKSERDLVGMELTGLLRGSDSNISNIRWP